ncbi:hypothetical protein K431DRAFT_281247 [Polychaeton citri CBS 116435]|uniref:RING-type E3 ubiquitin transferase n=1 Tax=Polychaeton citri CBS 116435 TaxID=1314669 RepID=A0A9P4QI49_9PEZI|nr:hypothetical protein K431DRAFT_281247 [Polychaeton citri CBS 116435]
MEYHDIPDTVEEALAGSAPPSNPPDIMNDAAYDPPPSPPRRTDTISTDGGPSDKPQETCRICRSEATSTEPLFHPCKCSGSIKYVHQDCLMEWLSHSNKKHCELCKTPFHFTKLYDSTMPSVLPMDVFLTRASLHVSWGIAKWCRIVLVGSVWLAVLPWIIRWCWRWMFWFADAGWAKEQFLYKLHAGELLPNGHTPADQTQTSLREAMTWIKEVKNAGLNGTLNRTWDVVGLANRGLQISAHIIDGVSNVTVDLEDVTESHGNNTVSFLYSSRPSTSLFSEWSYIANMTSSPRLNSVMVDIFEGQLITAIVIIGFILVFLIREWVVQQQPLINLENDADRLNAEDDRLRRQRDLLDAARERVHDIQQTIGRNDGTEPATDDEAHYQGWDRLEAALDRANICLMRDDVPQQLLFTTAMKTIGSQIVAARRSGVPTTEMAEKLSKKITLYEERHRQIWQASLVISIDHALQDPSKSHQRATEGEDSVGRSSDTTPQAPSQSVPDTLAGSSMETTPSNSDDDNGPQRPQLDRQLTSKAADIQRILQEASSSSQEDLTNFNAQAQPKPDSPRPNEGPPSELSGSSWEEVAPQTSQHQQGSRSNLHAALCAARMHGRSLYDESHEWIERPDTLVEPLPIINAGSDTELRLKIRRRDGDVESAQQIPLLLRVPEPTDPNVVDIDQSILRRLEQIPMVTASSTDSPASVSETSSDVGPTESSENTQAPSSEPTAMDQLEAELAAEENSVPTRISEYLMEDLGIDEAERMENLRQAGLGPVRESNATGNLAPANGSQPQRNVVAQENPKFQGPLASVFEWFWGDLAQQSPGHDPVNANSQARLGQTEVTENVPPPPPPPQHQVQEGPEQPVLDHQDPPADQLDNDPARIPDAIPEVGVEEDAELPDAEAMEDAEDLEGIFELVGLHGPIIGLFQTATFCTVLVTATIVGAVGLPYIWGKIVLSFVGAPWRWLVTVPLSILGVIADGTIDLALLLCGTVAILLTSVAKGLLNAMEIALPMLSSTIGTTTGFDLVQTIHSASLATAQASLSRLSSTLGTTEFNGRSNPMGWNWAVLNGNVQAHQSLKDLEGEFDFTLQFIKNGTLEFADFVANGTVGAIGEKILGSAKEITGIQTYLQSWSQKVALCLGSWKDIAISLKENGLTLKLSSSPQSFDPALINWSTSERAVTVLVGYIALSILAAIYVAADTPLTSSEGGRKVEKQIRDNVRQAGGVCKVIVVISIEMLVFPLYCGMLLDVAFLPLFSGATLATRIAYASRAPATFCFMHWITGTAYMFHFALFVGMCRKILRKGVLWFIRDPDDPTFHPVREVLERNILTQLRKIGYSAVIYGALVILCLGGIVWGIAKGFKDVFPLMWVTTEPTIEFPLDLLLINCLTPFVLRLFKPNDLLQGMYAWWLKKCARVLRVSHFLFDDRHEDEEGHSTRWSLRRLFRRGASGELAFVHDGKYALTPCNDQYRPPKIGEAYIHVASPTQGHDIDSLHLPHDIKITDMGGINHPNFAVVYIPPLFRYRIGGFMVCLWLFTAFLGLSVTLLPLVLGRRLLALSLPQVTGKINDLYAFFLGAYLLGGISFAALRFKAAAHTAKEKVQAVKELQVVFGPLKSITIQSFSCLYVYGIFGVAFPLLVALLLHFYVMLPAHTYTAGLSERGNISNAATLSDNNSTSAGIFGSLHDIILNTTAINPIAPTTHSNTNLAVTSHSFHLLQDYALGLLYIRIGSRVFFSSSGPTALEAFRRVRRDGFLNPNARLATRYFFLPALLLTSLLMFTPIAAMKAAMSLASAILSGFDPAQAEKTRLYRYSYPICAGAVLVVSGMMEVIGMIGRWRLRIRDEVYLVGERLHNFGENRPPPGSKSFVRRDRLV